MVYKMFSGSLSAVSGTNLIALVCIELFQQVKTRRELIPCLTNINNIRHIKV